MITSVYQFSEMRLFNKIFTGIVILWTLFSCGTSKYDLRFFAIGDMPYHVPEDYDRFERLISDLNKENPDFTVHVGDIKGGSSPCTDSVYQKIYNFYQQFTHPFILTPGDNDWTDCRRERAGAYDPVERLSRLREVYYRNNTSMGHPPMNLISQSSYPGYGKFVENAMWEKEGVMFATVHVVGSNNNFNSDQSAENKEFSERDSANLFWLGEVFDRARSQQSNGLVLFLHAALNFKDSPESGFRNFTKKLRMEVMNFDRPVLMVYGDHHAFMVSKPLRDDDGRVLTNFTALMVFGDHDMHAVEVRVNRKYDSLFEIRQHFVKGN